MNQTRRAGNAPEDRDGNETASQGKRSRWLDRALDLAEAFLWIALLAVGSLIALTVLKEDSGRPTRTKQPAAEVSVEAEDMRVVATEPRLHLLAPAHHRLPGRALVQGRSDVRPRRPEG